MKLKEFDLDLPYIENELNIKNIIDKLSCSYWDAKKIDYNNTWKEKRRNFNLQTRCVTSMFERLFPDFNTDDCEKVVVECVGEITNENIINYLGVYTIQVKFDYYSFINQSIYDKKVSVLNLLLEGILKIIDLKGWSLQPFLETKEEIIKSNYMNEWNFKLPIKNSDKKYIAVVKCIHEVEDFTITLLVTDKNKKEIKFNSLIEKPHEFAYAKHLGMVKWITENNVVLINKKGDTILNLSI